MDGKYERNVYLAMLSEQCEKYEDMRFYLEEIFKFKMDYLNLDECNLISISYRKIINFHRNALKTIKFYESQEKKKENSFYIKWIQEYKNKIEIELVDICTNIVNNMDTYLIPKAKDIETQIFYNKTKADCYRYMAENVIDNKIFAEKALKCYNEASDLSKQIPKMNQLRLGTALNLSIFHNEILGDIKTAYKITKETLEISSKAFEEKDEEDLEFKDSFRILDSMKENLQLWNESPAFN